jgi:glyoxalase family protein
MKSMLPVLTGLHHVTAITADAQKNIDFYTGLLGLRLVKLTVNFDDPASYHLYYGDELGRPGTIMTFFAWPGAGRGQIGPPQVSSTGFAVPAAAIQYWQSRFNRHEIAANLTKRFGQQVLEFRDPDGLQLEIVGVAEPRGTPWQAGPIPVEQAIRGFHGVTISEDGYERTAKLLTETMGFKPHGGEGIRYRYKTNMGDGFAGTVDILCVPGAHQGEMGAGVVHHVAYRTENDEEQRSWHKQIVKTGLNVSPIIDRNYFHSIYYREPGGVLFEIATNNPGFAVDEPAEQLGTRLMLPPQYQKYRAEIEKVLPPVKLPAKAR